MKSAEFVGCFKLHQLSKFGWNRSRGYRVTGLLVEQDGFPQIFSIPWQRNYTSKDLEVQEDA